MFVFFTEVFPAVVVACRDSLLDGELILEEELIDVFGNKALPPKAAAAAKPKKKMVTRLVNKTKWFEVRNTCLSCAPTVSNNFRLLVEWTTQIVNDQCRLVPLSGSLYSRITGYFPDPVKLAGCF